MPLAWQDLAVRVDDPKRVDLCMVTISHDHRWPDRQTHIPDPTDKEHYSVSRSIGR